MGEVGYAIEESILVRKQWGHFKSSTSASSLCTKLSLLGEAIFNDSFSAWLPVTSFMYEKLPL